MSLATSPLISLLLEGTPETKYEKMSLSFHQDRDSEFSSAKSTLVVIGHIGI